MSKETLKLKEKEVESIKDKASRAKSFVIIDYRGLTVMQDTEMRNAFRSQNVDYKVLKNRLVKRALESLGYDSFDKALEGPTAVAFGFDDAIAPAKIVVDSIAKYRKMSIKGAVIENKVIEADEVKSYASIPAKPVLVAQLLGMLTNPMRSLAVALSEVAKKKA